MVRLLFVFLFLACTSLISNSQDVLKEHEAAFAKLHWFERGIEHGNLLFTRRLRVNAPEAGIGRFHGRVEVRGNGMVQILMEEDLTQLDGAMLYAEMWGGHPGTSDKRVIVNGRSTYPIADLAEEHHCTYSYPHIPLKVTDLVNGYNVIQFACEQGDTFWGHFLIDNVCLIVFPKRKSLETEALQEFDANVVVAKQGDDQYKITLDVDSKYDSMIDGVQFQGWYDGYDENGQNTFEDWHGFTKNREPHAMLGSTDQPPYEVTWDASMLAAQDQVSVRAYIRFKEHDNLYYITQPSGTFSIPNRDTNLVKLHLAEELPKPFWSRAERLKECAIVLDEGSESIEQAILHVLIWDGGKGSVENPFTLNGHPLPVAGEGRHDLIYQKINVDPSILKKGENQIKVLSDTSHHGIEVLLPGPALMVRYKQ